MTIDVKPADVLAATREYTTTRNDRIESWAVPDAVAARLGIREAYNRPSTTGEYQAVVRFEGQVSRALNILASDGTLRKVGRGQTGPDGSVASNAAFYYTPDAWDAATERHTARQAVAAEAESAWATVYDRMTALGFTPHEVPNPGRGWDNRPVRGLPVYLGLKDVETLLSVAEARQSEEH